MLQHTGGVCQRGLHSAQFCARCPSHPCFAGVLEAECELSLSEPKGVQWLWVKLCQLKPPSSAQPGVLDLRRVLYGEDKSAVI